MRAIAERLPQTMQNYQWWLLSSLLKLLSDYKFVDLSGNQPLINFKRLFDLKIFSVKFPSVPISQGLSRLGVSLSIPSCSLVNTFFAFLAPEDNSGGSYHSWFFTFNNSFMSPTRIAALFPSILWRISVLSDGTPSEIAGHILKPSSAEVSESSSMPYKEQETKLIAFCFSTN